MRALLAIGSQDVSGTNSAENIASTIENLKAQGFTDFAVVPPNVQVNAAKFNEIASAARTAGAQVVNGVFDSITPDILSPTGAATLAREFADATVIGDSNAVRINGGVVTDLANVDLSTTTLTNAVSSIAGSPDLLDPRALASSGLAEGSRIFNGSYDQANEVLRNVGGRTFAVPRSPTAGGITNTASGAVEATAPQAPNPAQQRLAQVSNIRPYVPVRATEDRYDFLTGRKVFSTAGDGAPGSGGGSGRGQGGGTLNLKGVRGSAPASFNRQSAGGVSSVNTNLNNVRADQIAGTIAARDPDANDPRGNQIAPPSTTAATDPDANDPRGNQIAPPSTTPAPTPAVNQYGQVEEGRFVNPAGQTYTQSDIDSVERLKSFNTDLGDGAAQSKLTPGEKAYLEDPAAEEPVDSSKFPFIHPEDTAGPIHTFNTGDKRVDYVARNERPFHLPASEGDYVVTRTNDQGGEIIIYVFQETDQFWFPFTIPGYEAESGAGVPFKNLDNIVRQPT